MKLQRQASDSEFEAALCFGLRRCWKEGSDCCCSHRCPGKQRKTEEMKRAKKTALTLTLMKMVMVRRKKMKLKMALRRSSVGIVLAVS